MVKIEKRLVIVLHCDEDKVKTIVKELETVLKHHGMPEKREPSVVVTEEIHMEG